MKKFIYSPTTPQKRLNLYRIYQISKIKMFCPKCGSILVPRKEDSKKMFVCSCGYKTANLEATTIKETIVSHDKNVEVVDKGELQTLPKTTVECPKCGHRTAYFWLVQTRAGDEPETKFLKCEKCGHTWRDYD